MKYALNLAEDSRVLSVTEERYAPIGAVIVDEVPDDYIDYCYIEGAYVYDPLPKPAPVPIPTGNDAVWDELDAAYQEGYQEGVDSV